MMETINDILKEMRGRSIDDRYMDWLADRIEAAHKRESVTICNHLNEILEEANGIAESVTSPYIEKKARRIYDLCKQIDLQGNGAKIREALEWCRDFMRDIYDGKEGVKFSAYEIERIDSALSAPPRNCDIHNGTGEAMRRYGFPTKSKPWTEADWVKFVDWLYDEAKGEHNEQ